MKRLVCTCILFLLITVVALETAAQPVTVPSDPYVFLDLVNKARSKTRKCGRTAFDAAPPLRWEYRLAEAAAVHAVDISTKGEFSHTGSDNSSVADRVRRAGYNFSLTGENIAMNSMGALSTMEMWLASPGHCANIMNSDFRELGAATEGDYSVIVFGSR